VKIAIVGSGISGLTSAHLLHPDHKVTVFEANDYVGGHTNTVDVMVGERSHAIDTGFIVYNERTYPNFTRLLAQLGVETQLSDMSFSLDCERTGLQWAGGRGLNGVFAQRRNVLRPSFRRMLREIFRFGDEALRLLETGDEKVTLGDYLCGAGYSQEFVDHYVVPMGAAIWSASPSEFLRFPAATFVRFFDNHGLLQRTGEVEWRAVKGGSQRYVDALVAPFRHRIRTRCPVLEIRRDRRGVDVVTHAGVERFDRVVLALHSNQALRLLSDASELERHVLGSIRYQANEALLHTDASAMPSNRRAWASWNYRKPEKGLDQVFVTYHMNRLQSLDVSQDFFLTLNGSHCVDPNQVMASFHYDHPVFDGPALAAQRLHGAIDGRLGTHFCGAYWGHGFHEDGVRSALTVCRKISEEL
jgi:predicted NAD/FAD-binding protein